MFQLHKTSKKNLSLLIIITCTGCMLSSAMALDSDKYQAMHVASDSATYNRDEHTITYEGKVQGDQGSSRLDGDKLVVFQMPGKDSAAGNNIQKVIVYGNPAHYSTLTSPDKPRVYIEALKITYDPNKKTALLEGHGRVNQEGNVFTGPYIWYDMVNGVVHSRSAPGKERTEMTIQPQQNSNPKK